MATVDQNVLVSGFLRHAARQPSPRAWLEGLHEQAVAAVASGDQFVTTTAFDSVSSSMERSIDATQLLSVLERCLVNLDAEEGGDRTDGSVHVADFSDRRSEWG